MRLIQKPDATYKKINTDNAAFIPQDLVNRGKKKKTVKGKKTFSVKIPVNAKNDTKYIEKMSDNKIVIKNLTNAITEEDCKQMIQSIDAGNIYTIKLFKSCMVQVSVMLYSPNQNLQPRQSKH